MLSEDLSYLGGHSVEDELSVKRKRQAKPNRLVEGDLEAHFQKKNSRKNFKIANKKIKNTSKKDNIPSKQQTEKFPISIRAVLAEREVPLCQCRFPRFPPYITCLFPEYTATQLGIPWKKHVSPCQCERLCQFATEYLVRWEGLAYQYVQWVEESALEEDVRGSRALKLFLNKQLIEPKLNWSQDEDSPPFCLEYLEVERVVAEKLMEVEVYSKRALHDMGLNCSVCLEEFLGDFEVTSCTCNCCKCGDRCHISCTVLKETTVKFRRVVEKRSCKNCEKRSRYKLEHHSKNTSTSAELQASKNLDMLEGVDTEKRQRGPDIATQEGEKNQKYSIVFTKGPFTEFQVDIVSEKDFPDAVACVSSISESAPEEIRTKLKVGDAILEMGRVDALKLKNLPRVKQALSRIPEGNVVTLKIIHNFCRTPPEPCEGCVICGIDDDWENILLCDVCNAEFHLQCYGLETHPEDTEEFFCRSCIRAYHHDILQKTKRVLKVYLVKWRGLPISEGTWEPEHLIQDSNEIVKYTQRCTNYSLKLPLDPVTTGFEKLTKDTIPLKTIELRDYQLEGVNWILNRWESKISCLLADEMGLGKTVQAIAALSFLFQKCHLSPFLVVVPLSTLSHWQTELEAFSPMNIVVLHGTAEDRCLIWEHEIFQPQKINATEQLYQFQCLLTTFETCKSESSKLSQVSWSVMVIDEGHRLKGMETQVRKILQEDMKSCFRVLLTGTPIQNSTEELFSLLHFLNPDEFTDKDLFMRNFGNLSNSTQVEKLQVLLRRYMLRRVKSDVEKILPEKIETIINVELTSLQKQYYRAILEKNRHFLTKGLSKSLSPSLMNVMMQLRKLCNHPFLIQGVRERLEANKNQDKHDVLDSANPLVQCSGKLILLEKLLNKLKNNGSKVLIFSQMRLVLDILEEFMICQHHSYARLDGMITGMERASAVQRFNEKSSNIFCFLLTSKAGGVGLNLQTADTVVIFDSDWNPQNDIQAMSRSHRIGQTKQVHVYRLVTRKTYEHHLFQTASLKLGLDVAVLGGLCEDTSSKRDHIGVLNSPSKSPFSPDEINTLLKKGAYELLSEDDRTASETSKSFAEEDIESILKSTTHTHQVVHKEGSGADCRKPSVFSHATFISSSSQPEVALDDPDFWKKMLPQAPTISEQLALMLQTNTHDEHGQGYEASEQFRLQFLAAVEKAALPIIQARSNGETPDDMGEMLQFLHMVHSHPKFSDTENEHFRKSIEELVLSIEKPKRKRKGVRAELSENSGSEGEGSKHTKKVDASLSSCQLAELRERRKAVRLEARKEQRAEALAGRREEAVRAKEELRRQKEAELERRREEKALQQKLRKQAELQRQAKREQERLQEQAAREVQHKRQQLLSEITQTNKKLQYLYGKHNWRNYQLMNRGVVQGVSLPPGKDFLAIFHSEHMGCRLSQVSGFIVVEKLDSDIAMRCPYNSINRDILIKVNSVCILGISLEETIQILEQSPIKCLLLRRPDTPFGEDLYKATASALESQLPAQKWLDFNAKFIGPQLNCIVTKEDGAFRIWSLSSSRFEGCPFLTLNGDILIGVNGNTLAGKSELEAISMFKECSLPRILHLRRCLDRESETVTEAQN